jgi:hypothetical protein
MRIVCRLLIKWQICRLIRAPDTLARAPILSRVSPAPTGGRPSGNFPGGGSHLLGGEHRPPDGRLGWPPEGDGTKFWERGGAGWTETRLVLGRFNRLLIFDAALPHSRAIFENYGEGDDARLIQVIFLR